jgi:hypothetical protein
MEVRLLPPQSVRRPREHVFVPRYSCEAAEAAVAASFSYAEALRRLGMCPTGGAHLVLKTWVARWGIDVSHFDPDRRAAERGRATAQPLHELLVEGSTVRSSRLKQRLYEAGLKDRSCELCSRPRRPEQRYCSCDCAQRTMPRPTSHPRARRVERPPLDVLLAQVEAGGWEATGRAYGVSGNAVRKWVAAYRWAA